MIIKLPVKKRKKRLSKDYSNYRCIFLLNDGIFNVCEASKHIICNGTYAEFKDCPLKKIIISKSKELKIYKNFLKIKKMEKCKEEIWDEFFKRITGKHRN